MTWLVVPFASAAPPPPPPAPVIEVVSQFQQGQVRLFMAGRDGDKVYIDGFPFGTLPLTTELTEGPHQFRVEGPSGKHVIDLEVKIVPDAVAELDLGAKPAPPPVPAPAPASAPVPAASPKP